MPNDEGLYCRHCGKRLFADPLLSCPGMAAHMLIIHFLGSDCGTEHPCPVSGPAQRNAARALNQACEGFVMANTGCVTTN
jgi:hypothetical protein